MMNQNKIIVFFVLLFFSIVFLFFSFLVWITRGKKDRFIFRKIKTGMYILTLTGLLSVLGCDSCTSRPLCYVAVQANVFEFQNFDEEYRIKVMPNEGRAVHGKVFNRYSEKFAFEIINEENGTSAEGPILPIDGSYDSAEEDIVFELPDNAGAGMYRLSVFAVEETRKYLVYSGSINIE
ncbi:MAG: hypothetical protein JXB88_24435 [Spirochaetales bacterium]|nr:hypothetical protein [Spirochaetales bacterium]